MFDLNTYKKDCDRLTLSRDTLEEMIVMTEQKRTKGLHPVRVAMLSAALIAALSLTAAATDGPIKDMIEEIIITFTYVAKSDADFAMTLNGDVDMLNGVVLPTMAYAEKDGRKILALDGEEIDVTKAMEKDGYYERELEGATLRVTVDGMATITVHNEKGEVEMTYTVGLNEEGVASKFDLVSQWEGMVDENGTIIPIDIEGGLSEDYEVKGAYTVTEKDGAAIIHDSDGNEVAGRPQE